MFFYGTEDREIIETANECTLIRQAILEMDQLTLQAETWLEEAITKRYEYLVAMGNKN